MDGVLPATEAVPAMAVSTVVVVSAVLILRHNARRRGSRVRAQ